MKMIIDFPENKTCYANVKIESFNYYGCQIVFYFRIDKLEVIYGK